MKHNCLLLVFVLAMSMLQAQYARFDWAKTFGSSDWESPRAMTTDRENNVYTVGFFKGIVDFDPGPSSFGLNGGNGTFYHFFIQKLDSNGNFLWARSIGGNRELYINSIVTDSSNNVYLTGEFEGIVDFDPGPGVFNMNGSTDYDVFILKLDENGNFLWAKEFGAGGEESGNSIVIDSSQNVYVYGSYKGLVDFDPGTGVFDMQSQGHSDAFIEKLDANGNFLWAKFISGISPIRPTSMIIDQHDDIYLTGSFAGTVDFNPNATDTFNLDATGFLDLYVAKINTNGGLTWVKSFDNGPSFVSSSNITTDPFNNILLTGMFSGITDIDPDTGSTAVFNLIGGRDDIFVLKLDSAGTFVWAKNVGGPSRDDAYAIVTDSLGNVLVTGGFGNTIDFDPGVGVFNLTSVNVSFDVFYLMLDDSGDFMWAKTIGQTSRDVGICMAIDQQNDILIAGQFSYSDALDFDPDPPIFTSTSLGSSDIFVQKFSNENCDFKFGADVQEACGKFIWIDGNTYTTNDTTAMHTLFGATAGGCDSTVMLNLTVKHVNTNTIKGDGNIASQRYGAAYQWLDCNDGYSVISGATARVYRPVVNGRYAVEVTDDGCVDTSQCVTISNIVSGIEDQSWFHNISIFPNPVSDQLFFNSDVATIRQISVLDVTGKVMITEVNPNNVVEVGALPQGTYFIQFRTDQGMMTRKLIKN